MNLRQKSFLTLVVIANIVAWAIPSNVAQLVAMDRPTLLGRYSREHFTVNIGIALLSIIGLYIDQARTPATYQRRWFQVIAVAIVLLPCLFIADAIIRTRIIYGYVDDRLDYH